MDKTALAGCALQLAMLRKLVHISPGHDKVIQHPHVD